VPNPAASLNGRIEKRLNPRTPSAEPNCTKCTDDRKGKPKDRPGDHPWRQKAEGKDVWEGGKILDPENGSDYTLRMTPIDGGKKLEVRGSFGPLAAPRPGSAPVNIRKETCPVST
jgi:hypothetical protein